MIDSIHAANQIANQTKAKLPALQKHAYSNILKISRKKLKDLR